MRVAYLCGENTQMVGSRRHQWFIFDGVLIVGHDNNDVAMMGIVRGDTHTISIQLCL